MERLMEKRRKQRQDRQFIRGYLWAVHRFEDERLPLVLTQGTIAEFTDMDEKAGAQAAIDSLRRQHGTATRQTMTATQIYEMDVREQAG